MPVRLPYTPHTCTPKEDTSEAVPGVTQGLPGHPFPGSCSERVRAVRIREGTRGWESERGGTPPGVLSFGYVEKKRQPSCSGGCLDRQSQQGSRQVGW